MPLKLVVDAVEARLAAEWSACPVVGINSGVDAPKDGSSHLVVQYPVSNSSQLTIGAPGQNIWREEGAIRVIINRARGDGLSAALTWADQLAALFRGKNFGGVQTFAPTSPAIDDRNDQGNFFQVSISVPYQADVIG